MGKKIKSKSAHSSGSHRTPAHGRERQQRLARAHPRPSLAGRQLGLGSPHAPAWRWVAGPRLRRAVRGGISCRPQPCSLRLAARGVGGSLVHPSPPAPDRSSPPRARSSPDPLGAEAHRTPPAPEREEGEEGI